MCVVEDIVCLAEDNSCTGIKIRLIEFLVYSGRAGNDRLVARIVLDSLKHHWQVGLYLLFATTRQQCDYRLVGKAVTFNERATFLGRIAQESINGINTRVAYVVDPVIMLLLKEVNLERKDREQFVHIALDILYTMLFPCPYLGRDVIVYRNLRVLVYILRDGEVEARIIDKDEDIRIPRHNIPLAKAHIGENRAQMHEYRNEAHICEFAIMLHALPANSRHKVTAEEAELGTAVNTLYCFHQVRRVKVARSLTNNEIIFHMKLLFLNQNSQPCISASRR